MKKAPLDLGGAFKTSVPFGTSVNRALGLLLYIDQVVDRLRVHRANMEQVVT